eukprot:GHVN01102297.1.p1 GENE.GHVN01102297.1~~GHVN01102297.1.p1  ORF type:complete len:109 (-),score=2.65 GHVN01102297.1:734-1060(-)
MIDLFAGAQQIRQVSDVRDLVTRYDDCGKFDIQVAHAVWSGHYGIFEFKQRFKIRSADAVRQYHVPRIRPVLEYNFAVWGPMRADQMSAIEGVQKRVLNLKSCIEVVG